MTVFYRLSKVIIAALIPAAQGPRARVSERYDNYYLSLPGVGRFPLRFRFLKTEGPGADRIYRPIAHFRKRGRDADGHGYATDHWEFNLYARTVDQAEQAGVEIHVLDFVHCPKNEDIGFKPAPEQAWRMTGTINKGVLYAYDPDNQPKIQIGRIESEVLDSFPVRITAVGVQPVPGSDHSVPFPKYEVFGVDCLYDRREKRNGAGWLEVVQNTKGQRSWKYLNLKGLEGELPDGAAILTNNEEKSKLVVKKDDMVVSF